MSRHLGDNWLAAVCTGLDDYRVSRLLGHDVPTVDQLWLRRVLHHSRVAHGRARWVSVIVATMRDASLLDAWVLSEPWQLDDGLEPRGVATEDLGTRGKSDEDPEEDRI